MKSMITNALLLTLLVPAATMFAADSVDMSNFDASKQVMSQPDLVKTAVSAEQAHATFVKAGYDAMFVDPIVPSETLAVEAQVQREVAGLQAQNEVHAYQRKQLAQTIAEIEAAKQAPLANQVALNASSFAELSQPNIFRRGYNAVTGAASSVVGAITGKISGAYGYLAGSYASFRALPTYKEQGIYVAKNLGKVALATSVVYGLYRGARWAYDKYYNKPVTQVAQSTEQPAVAAPVAQPAQPVAQPAPKPAAAPRKPTPARRSPVRPARTSSPRRK
jgi:hypothetical protein